MGVKVSSEFSLISMRQNGEHWHPAVQLKGQFQVNLPLPANWRVFGSPQTVQLNGRKWLLLPVSIGS